MPAPEDWARFVASTDEFEAVKELLDAADERLSLLRYISRDSHVLTALLAPGVEKLLKLTYGYMRMHDNDAWPGAEIHGYRHRIADMDAECRRLIEPRIEAAIHPKIVQRAAAVVDQDPFIRPLLGLLQAYGQGGRFSNLDTLAARATADATPRELWQELDYLVMETLGFDLDPDVFDARRSERLRRSLRQWRFLYHQVWVQDVIGPRGRQYAFEMGGHER